MKAAGYRQAVMRISKHIKKYDNGFINGRPKNMNINQTKNMWDSINRDVRDILYFINTNQFLD